MIVCCSSKVKSLLTLVRVFLKRDKKKKNKTLLIVATFTCKTSKGRGKQ